MSVVRLCAFVSYFTLSVCVWVFVVVCIAFCLFGVLGFVCAYLASHSRRNEQHDGKRTSSMNNQAFVDARVSRLKLCVL